MHWAELSKAKWLHEASCHLHYAGEMKRYTKRSSRVCYYFQRMYLLYYLGLKDWFSYTIRFVNRR